MDDIRDEVIDELSTKCFITKQQLRNVRRDFNLHIGRQHSSDATSVQLWVNSMQKLERGQNPVVLYKPQGVDDPSGILTKDDVCLVIMTSFQQMMLTEFGKEKICIDSTHGTNAYEFDLTTLLTVDEFGAGCPGAFCLSNRKDCTMWKYFFTSVFEKIGPVETSVFMSDDDPSFYNAWVDVMGPVKHRLLCTWHVDRNWRKISERR